MEIRGNDYRQLLIEELEQRQRRNPNYSLRSFARFLNLSPSTLSLVLNGKRGFGERHIQSISESFNFDTEERRLFRTLVLFNDAHSESARQQLKKDLLEQTGERQELGTKDLSLESFRMISDWYHLTIFELLETNDYQFVQAEMATEWIARRLNLTKIQVKSALRRLETLGMVEFTDGKPNKASSSIKTGDSVPSSAVRQHHKSFLEKAQDAIETQEFEECNFSGIIVPVDPARFNLAKKEIKKFRKKMNELLRGESPKEVYRLSVNFFRVSKQGL